MVKYSNSSPFIRMYPHICRAVRPFEGKERDPIITPLLASAVIWDKGALCTSKRWNNWSSAHHKAADAHAPTAVSWLRKGNDQRFSSWPNGLHLCGARYEFVYDPPHREDNSVTRSGRSLAYLIHLEPVWQQRIIYNYHSIFLSMRDRRGCSPILERSWHLRRSVPSL